MSLTGGLIPLGSKKPIDTKSRPSYDFDDDDDIDAVLGDTRESAKPSKPSAGIASRKSSNSAQQRRQHSQFNRPRSGSISDSFDSVPSPTPQGSNKYRTESGAHNNSFDDETLSQASSSAPSPVDKKPPAAYHDNYQKKEYNPLADISATSADLEDSILGGLLGGGSKKSAKPAAKSATKIVIPPVASTSIKSSSRSPMDKEGSLGSSSDKVPSITPKASTVSSFRETNFDDSGDLSPRKPSPSYKSTRKGPIFTFNSNADNEDSVDFDNMDLLPNSELSRPPKASMKDSRSRSRSPETRDDYKAPVTGHNAPVASDASFSSNNGKTATASSTSAPAAGEKERDDGDLGGFLPSFLDPERRSRQRRNVGGRSMKPNAGDPLDELDKVLGLAPVASDKQKVADPFSNVSSRLSSSAGRSSSPPTVPAADRGPQRISAVIDSDDSDSDVVKPSTAASVGRSSGGGADLGSVFPSISSNPGSRPSTAAADNHGDDITADNLVSKKQLNATTKIPAKSVTVSIPSADEVVGSAPLSVTSQGRKSSIAKASSSSDSNELAGLTLDGSYTAGTGLNIQVPQHFDVGGSGSVMTSPQDFAASGSGAPSGANRKTTPAWLSSPGNASSGTGSGNNITGSGAGHNATSSHSMKSPGTGSEQQQNIARSLQLKVEEITLEKEAVVRQMRLEIDSLKCKLANSSIATGASSSQSRVPTGDEVAKDFVDQHFTSDGNNNNPVGFDRFAKERIELNNIIRQLESEISRLKDEAILRTSRHQEELTHLTSKFNSDAEDLKSRHADNIRNLESRHVDTINALKAIHAEEIKGIRERAKDKVLLEQLSGQITNTSGSIKFIEEQLNARHRGLEAVREGQIEARERLLEELETQAKHRAEAAETEAYKLKGLLIHMEQMMSSMKQQSVDEKTRLQQENDRLSSLHMTLESERKSMQSRMDDELQLLKIRMKEVDNQYRQLQADKRAHNEAVLEANEKDERSKAEFKKLVEENTKAFEQSARKLKEEETRLETMRHEISKELNELNETRARLQGELRESKENQAQLDRMQMELQAEKLMMQETAQRLQRMSEDFNQQYEEVEAKDQSLVEREEALHRGVQELNQAGSALIKKEQQLMALKQLLENRQLSLEQQAQEIDQLHVIRLGQHRQQLTTYTTQVMASSTSSSHQTQFPPPPVKSFSPSKMSHRNRPPSAASDAENIERLVQDHSSDAWIDNFRRKLANSAGANLMLKERYIDYNSNARSSTAEEPISTATVGKPSWSATYLKSLQSNANNRNRIDPVVAELRGARKTLQDSREALQSTSEVYSLERENYLDRENAAMEQLRRLRSQR